MSATRNGDPTDEGQEGRVSSTGDWAQMAQEGEGTGGGSGPQECDVAPVAGEAEVAGPGEVEAIEAEGGPEEEERSEQALVLAPNLEGSNNDEDSDIEPAEEEGGDQNISHGLIVDARQFPMVGFRFMFLDLVHTLLHRLHYNDHILIRSDHHVIVRPRPPAPDGSGELLALSVPQRPRVMAASLEGEGEGPSPGLSRASSILALEEPREELAAALHSDEPSEEVPVVITEQEADEKVEEMAVGMAEKVVEEPAKDSVEYVTLSSEITQEQDDNHSEDKDIEEEEKEGAEEDTKEEN